MESNIDQYPIWTWYYCRSHALTNKGSLVDRGANGGLCGTHVRLIDKTGRSIDIQGIDNNQITDVPIVTAGDIVHTQRGPVILIFHQYAYIGHGKTIHSSRKLGSFNCDINDKPMKVNGVLKRIITQEGFAIPLYIVSGLPYVNLRPYTDK